MTWAKGHPEYFPIDVNAAARETLLRVPGIGYRNVDRIVRIRRYHRLSLDDLRKLHVRLKLASPFIVAADHVPTATAVNEAPTVSFVAAEPAQLDLFAATSALTGSI